jgi:hypothetical protein
VHDLSGWDWWPEWLAMAAGYSGDGMISASFNGPDLNWQRQWYIAPDVDLRKLKIKNDFLRNTLRALNFLKFPAPALEINQRGKPQFYWLFF